MFFKKTTIESVWIITPELKIDKRGFFARTFCLDELKDHDINFQIVQANSSLTKKKGTIRGMHVQTKPKEEAKIVQCIKGKIYDVIIDLREKSPTRYQWIAEELTEENRKMIYIPKGFAHGFQTLTDNCELQYFMDEFYSPQYANGIRWSDPFFNITWPLKDISSSEKDESWPLIKKI